MPLQATAQTDVAAVENAAAQQFMQAHNVPGLVIAVESDGKTTVNGYGLANVTSSTPVDAQTRFEIGSITKQFTAAAILQLKEAGKLSLDDPLSKYVPQYSASAKVTIRQMLWQVSGIPEFTTETIVQDAQTQPASLAAVLARVTGKPLDFAPGSKWAYSNTNYYLLGYIVGEVSKTSWESYVREHIFAPAGMTHSAFSGDEAALSDCALGYVPKAGGVEPGKPLNGWGGGAGAIVSTGGDMLAWNDALFGGKIVSADDVNLMVTPGRLDDGRATEYGFGWIVSGQSGTQHYWHNGGTFGFSSYNGVYPQLHQAIIVLSNLAGVDAGAAGTRVLAGLDPALAKAEMAPAPGEVPAVTALAKAMWQQLQSGNLDRTKLTDAFSAFITPAVLLQGEAQLTALGTPAAWVYRGSQSNAGMTMYSYALSFDDGTVIAVKITLTKDGKIAGYSARPN